MALDFDTSTYSPFGQLLADALRKIASSINANSEDIAQLIANGGGGSGNVTPAASLVCDVNVPRGMPVSINLVNDHFVIADALFKSRSVVTGLADADTQATYVVNAYDETSITMDDWTNVAGQTLLNAGMLYFLAEGGGITTQRPTAAGSCVVVIGEAVNTKTLSPCISTPILL